jgi:hypothetical protein
MAVVPQTRVVDWRGDHYRFERMESTARPERSEIEWAVWCQGSFIGVMRSAPGESRLDFELGAFRWLRDLLAAHSGVTAQGNSHS